MELASVQEYLSLRVFRLRIERDEKGLWWGTGFLVTPRTAITAYHNLPKALREAGGGQLTAWRVDADGQERSLVFDWIPGASGAGHDIAVLRLAHPETVAPLPYLRPAALPRRLTLPEMQRHWAGRHVAVYGFPVSLLGSGTASGRHSVYRPVYRRAADG